LKNENRGEKKMEEKSYNIGKKQEILNFAKKLKLDELVELGIKDAIATFETYRKAGLSNSEFIKLHHFIITEDDFILVSPKLIEKYATEYKYKTNDPKLAFIMYWYGERLKWERFQKESRGKYKGFIELK